MDGKRIAELRDGDTKHLLVAPGEHELAVRIDWAGSKSLRFSLAEGEIATFRVKSSCRGWRLLLGLWYAFFAWNSYLELVRLKVIVGDPFLDLH